MKLITIHCALNPIEAQVVRSRLDAGLLAIVQHETAALSLEGYALAAGGILVQVPEDQAEFAREILAATEPASE